MPFVKGQSGNPAGRKVGTKTKKTLDKEQRRILFEELVSERFEKLVHQAKAEYLIDQFIGKATDKHEHKFNFTFEDDDKVENLVGKVE